MSTYNIPKQKKTSNPNSLKELSRERNKIDNEKLNQNIAKKLDNQYYFTDRKLNTAFNNNLVSHHIFFLKSKLADTPNIHKL